MAPVLHALAGLLLVGFSAAYVGVPALPVAPFATNTLSVTTGLVPIAATISAPVISEKAPATDTVEQPNEVADTVGLVLTLLPGMLAIISATV